MRQQLIDAAGWLRGQGRQYVLQVREQILAVELC